MKTSLSSYKELKKLTETLNYWDSFLEGRRTTGLKKVEPLFCCIDLDNLPKKCLLWVQQCYRKTWCQEAGVVCKHLKCQPFYLPREFTAILFFAVFIPPTPNINDRKEAPTKIYHAISEQQTAYSDEFLILAGNFNNADLKAVLPKIHQQKGTTHRTWFTQLSKRTRLL